MLLRKRRVPDQSSSISIAWGDTQIDTYVNHSQSCSRAKCAVSYSLQTSTDGWASYDITPYLKKLLIKKVLLINLFLVLSYLWKKKKKKLWPNSGIRPKWLFLMPDFTTYSRRAWAVVRTNVRTKYLSIHLRFTV